MESLNDIESMTLERKYKNYLDSKGDFKFRIVVLGPYSVDLKSRLKFSSSDPDDPSKTHLVMRGHTHHRRRASLLKESRFTVGSDSDQFVKITAFRDNNNPLRTLKDIWYLRHHGN